MFLHVSSVVIRSNGVKIVTDTYPMYGFLICLRGFLIGSKCVLIGIKCVLLGIKCVLLSIL